jgi:predicted RNase H-like HicB family nuclease
MLFPVTLESDEVGWRAFSPTLEPMGTSTWGETREEALKNIREALTMMLEELLEEGEDMAAQSAVASAERNDRGKRGAPRPHALFRSALHQSETAAD